MSFQRSSPVWKIRGEELSLGVRTHICALVEIGPGSVLGGDHVDPDLVLAEVERLEDEGADFIDLNPSPARPADRPVPDDELRRLVPTLRKLQSRMQVPLIVTTPNTETAARAIELGVDGIHDISGLAFDEELAKTINDSDAALILGHMRGSPDEWSRQSPIVNLADMVTKDLQAALLRANRAGIDRRRIVVDPGLEHGKHGAENFDLIRLLNKLSPVGQGIQITLSGMRFLVDSVRASDAEKHAAVSVAATLALDSGAHILRVAEPSLVKLTAAAVDRIYRADDIRSRQEPEAGSQPVIKVVRPEAPSQPVVYVDRPRADSRPILKFTRPQADSKPVIHVEQPRADSKPVIDLTGPGTHKPLVIPRKETDS